MGRKLESHRAPEGEAIKRRDKGEPVRENARSYNTIFAAIATRVKSF